MNGKIYSVYKKILNGLVFIMFSLMTLITLINAITRFAFNSPIAWSAELARYSFVWIIFLGAALAVRNGSHIGLEFLSSKLPEKGKDFLRTAINYMIILFLCVFTIIGFEQAIKASGTESAAMQIPMLIPYMALPIGGIAMIIEFIRVINVKLVPKAQQETQEIL